MKRMLSLVLVLALLFALEIPVFAGDAGLQNFSPATAYVPFSDVPADAWYAENVKTVCEYGLMQGKRTGKVYAERQAFRCGNAGHRLSAA